MHRLDLLALFALLACSRPVPVTPSNVGYVLSPYQCRIAAPPIVSGLYSADPAVVRWYLEHLQTWSIDMWLCVSQAHAVGTKP